MRGIETFYRGEAIGVLKKSLPAYIYNAISVLLNSSDRDCVFVPIRSMQYMAVIDKEEVIFVDAISARHSIEFSWREFHRQTRTSLSQPVNYSLVYYDKKALQTMKQVQAEFDKAVQALYSKSKKDRSNQTADIVEFINKK